MALDTGFFRPIAAVVLDLMKRLGVTDPGRVAKVGDTQSDLEQGTAAGCRWVVGVLTGSSTREQLEGWPHTRIVDSVADVPRLFR